MYSACWPRGCCVLAGWLVVERRCAGAMMDQGAPGTVARAAAASGQQRKRRSRSGRSRGGQGGVSRGRSSGSWRGQGGDGEVIGRHGSGGGAQPQERVCYVCGASGHLKRQCPLASSDGAKVQAAAVHPPSKTVDPATDIAIGVDADAIVEVDGSTMEGGGQVLRLSCALGAICGLPLRVHSIRAKRPRPGLAAQHLTGLRLLEGAFLRLWPREGGRLAGRSLWLAPACNCRVRCGGRTVWRGSAALPKQP